jgi:hypothetical protein
MCKTCGAWDQHVQQNGRHERVHFPPEPVTTELRSVDAM